MTWTKCQRTYWMSVSKRPWFPYHPSGSEASLLFFQLLGKICNVSESEVQILVSAAGSDFAQGGWTVWSLDSLIKEWQSLKIHACPLLDVHRQSSAAHLPQHIPDSVCITMACLAKCMWRNLLNICWPAERLMKWVFRQPQNRGLTIAFLDIQLCVCAPLCLCSGILAIILRDKTYLDRTPGRQRRGGVPWTGLCWQISAHQASKEDADRSGEGSISQILCICFAASQCKSRLLLGRTAGELEANSLGLSVQPEPDCSCTTSDQPARTHLEWKLSK